MENEEKTLGVPLIPGREVSRWCPARWSGGSTYAPTDRRRLFVGAATFAVAALTVAVLAGVAPLAASTAVALMVPAAVIDVEQRRLPDAWAASALVALLVALAVEAAAGQPTGTPAPDLIGGLLGGLLGGALVTALPLLVLHVASPSAMGFGDVKAAVALGAAVGTIDWRLGPVALCLSALTGGVTGVLGRRRTIPFGPFLVFGAWVVVLAHDPIIAGLFAGGPTS